MQNDKNDIESMVKTFSPLAAMVCMALLCIFFIMGSCVSQCSKEVIMNCNGEPKSTPITSPHSRPTATPESTPKE